MPVKFAVCRIAVVTAVALVASDQPPCGSYEAMSGGLDSDDLRPEQRARVADLVEFHGVQADRAREAVRRGDHYREQLSIDPQKSPGRVLYERVRDEPVTDAEVRAFWSANRALFGSRPLAHCAPGIRRILQLRHTRTELDRVATQ